MGWKDLSIKTKVPLIVLTTSAVALALACAVFLAYGLSNARRTHERDLGILAEVISAQSSPAVAFGDKKTAGEILATLNAEPQVVSAAVYSGNGALFGSYVRPGADAGAVPSGPGADGSRYEGEFLIVVHPVLQEGNRIGSIYLRSDQSVAREELGRGVLITIVVLVISSLAALFLSLNLGRFIVFPILNLARTARRVSEEKDYSVRATPVGGDETGQLISGFNTMLSRIEEREAELKKNYEEIATLNRTLAERQDELSTYHDLVTHDVTNFAGTLMIVIQHLLSGAEGPLGQKQMELIQRANRQIFQLNRLAENAKTLVRLREKGLPPLGPPAALKTLLQQVAETVRSVHFDRKCRFDLECPESLEIVGLPLAENLFLNILDNAVRHSAAGPVTVEVAVQALNGSVEVAVRGGQPVEPELMSRLFERYTRGPHSRGGGLGLSVVREILQRAGGNVKASTVESAAGRVFQITLTVPRP